MFRNNNSSGNLKASRQIHHSRIEDEEIIYKKYDQGRKLGQVRFIIFIDMNMTKHDLLNVHYLGKLWRRL